MKQIDNYDKTRFGFYIKLIVTSLITIGSVWLGIYKYSLEMNHEKRLIFSQNLYETRAICYKNVGKVIGELLVCADNEQFDAMDKCFDKFKSLHLEILPIIQENDISAAMRFFIKDYEDFKKDYISLKEFKDAGYELAYFCQQSLIESYKSLMSNEKLTFVDK